MRYTILVLMLAVFYTAFTAHAQDIYHAVRGDTLTNIESWEVGDEPVEELPTENDTCVLHEDESFNYVVGGALTCGYVVVRGDVTFNKDDSLIVRDLDWENGKTPTGLGTLVFIGEHEFGPGKFRTNGTPTFSTISIEKTGLNPIAPSKLEGVADSPVFKARALHLRSGSLELIDVTAEVPVVQLLGTDAGLYIEGYRVLEGKYDVNSETLASILGEIQFHWTTSPPDTALVWFNELRGDPSKEIELEEGEVIIPITWEILSPVPFRWTFDFGVASQTIQIVGVYENASSLGYPKIPHQRGIDGRVFVESADHPLGDSGNMEVFIVGRVVDTAIEEEGVPEKFTLLPPYPNPFNPVTTIPVEMASAGELELSVYDVLGRRVRVLAKRHLPPGRHEVIFEADDLPSGLYIIRSNFGQSRTVTLLK